MNLFTFHTEGGGILFQSVFETLSSILYGDGTFKSLLKIALTFGAFCAVSMAFFRQKFDPLIRSFLLPGIGIVALVLVPHTNLTIVDHSNPKKQIQVERVPFALAAFSGWTSHAFYHLKNLFTAKEGIPWIRNLQEGENLLRPARFSLADPVAEGNYREFCRECVFRDLGIGLYSREELANAADLLSFLESNTSSLRRVAYTDQETILLPCKEAIQLIRPYLETAAEDCAVQWAAFKQQPNALFGRAEEDDFQRFIEQRIAMDFLSEAPSNSSFFAIASSSLLTLHHFFEALLYAAFPVIVLLSLLTFGIRIFIHWIKLLIWVHLWPIFYTVVELFLNSVWNFRREALLGSHPDFTLHATQKLAELHATLEILACAALITVPFLSWFLLKGGMSQIANLTTSPASVSEPRQVPVELPPVWHSSQDVESSRQSFTGIVTRPEEK